MSYRTKLIEVALPLEAINRASAKEKSIRHGHPSTLHLWWARRPLAACRAVLFASLVDDPSSRPEDFPTEEDQEAERQRLFRLIEELVKWERSNDPKVLAAVKTEIDRSTGGSPPAVLDPFCGGGSIPLEAQRLGLGARASDLNPVAVLITKALTELPARFAGGEPVNPDARLQMGSGNWTGGRGLADDVRWYGRWMREEAFKRIGPLYPPVELPDGGEARVIAWRWVRTVKCPNPACGVEMPLVRSFALVNNKANTFSARPVFDADSLQVRFEVDSSPPRGGTVGRGGATCVVCAAAVPFEYIREEGRAARIGVQLMSIIASNGRQRFYLPGSEGHDVKARSASPDWTPTGAIADNPGHTNVFRYGFTEWHDLFLPRQLVALGTFTELVGEARDRALRDSHDEQYADAIATYLGLAVGRSANYWSTLAAWGGSFVVQTFGRQALPMVWDFAEVNPFSDGSGNWDGALSWIGKCLEEAPLNPPASEVRQLDAMHGIDGTTTTSTVVCTDPPYYDNVPYAELSDYFYVWLRRSLASVHPDLFSTLLTPKGEELVAAPHRFDGDRARAKTFFETGLRRVFDALRDAQDEAYPLTMFYAFRQTESKSGDESPVSTGWETMLTGLVGSQFTVTGTWPVRSERDQGLKTGMNVLASSIVLVCRPRPGDAALATRREFVATLRGELPDALRKLQQGNIAPVDLAQAAIGPGMAVFSRHAKVVEADGSAMTVRAALGLINQALDEILAEQEGDFDADTRFAVTWFEQRGIEEGPFGEADVLARAKNTSVAGLQEAEVLASRAGKVRLLRRDELPEAWDPVTDRRPTAWEAAQHLTRRLEIGGEDAAAELLRRLGGDYGEQAKELAYRLYSICERKGWAQEALGYNALVVAWPEIARRVAGTPEAAAQEQLEI